MTKYINAEEFKNDIMTAMLRITAQGDTLALKIGEMLCHFVDDAPAADVQEVKPEEGSIGTTV